jgi:hypothetical protein
MLAQVLLEELGRQEFELAMADEDYPWFENFLMSQMIRMPVKVLPRGLVREAIE